MGRRGAFGPPRRQVLLELHEALGPEAVLAQRGDLYGEIGSGGKALSEGGEHAFGKVRRCADGSRPTVQYRLQRPAASTSGS